MSDESISAAADLCPGYLSGDARLVWDWIAPGLHSIGRLTGRYVDSVAEYCQARAELTRIRSVIADEGETYQAGDLIKSHPLLTQQERVWRRWRSLSVALGLSPADDRLPAKQEDQEADPWTEL